MIKHEMLPRPKTIDHRETFSYRWVLAAADLEGQSLPVANFSNRSIQVTGPAILLGSNDECDWYQILSMPTAGIYEIPLAIRAVKPVAIAPASPSPHWRCRVIVFINAA